MNTYMFGGLISKRTFIMFMASIAFFTALLGVGLGISAFAEEEEETPYPILAVQYMPQTATEVMSSSYEFEKNDFVGTKFSITYPAGCAYNADGTEAIVESFTLTADNILSFDPDAYDMGDENDYRYVSLGISIGEPAQTTEICFRVAEVPESENDLCFVNLSAKTKGADGTYASGELMSANNVCLSSDPAFELAVDDNFMYLVGEDEVYVANCISNGYNVTVPATFSNKPVTKILYHAFADKECYRNITIPEGVTHLEHEAIFLCYDIETIDIPASAVNVYEDSIIDNGITEAVNVAAGNTKYSNGGTGSDGVLYYTDENGDKKLLVYPSDKTDTEYTIDSDTKEIAYGAFSNAGYLKNVTFPQGLEKVGGWAFNCSALESVDLPDSVTEVGTGAFYQCENLELVEMGNVEAIKESTFSYDSGLTSFVVPESVKVIEMFAFSESGLTEIEIPATVQTIQNYAICSSEIDITIKGYTGSEAERYVLDDTEDRFNVTFQSLGDSDVVVVPFTMEGGSSSRTPIYVTVTPTGGQEQTVAIAPRGGSEESAAYLDLEDGAAVAITKMGYTEYSFTYDAATGVPEDITLYAGELNYDDYINLDDLLLLIERHGYQLEPGTETYDNYWFYDFDGNSYVNLDDILIVIDNIGLLY